MGEERAAEESVVEERTPHRLCVYIDSKKLAMLGDAAEAEVDLFRLDDFENYWCKRTWTDSGPDGGWVTYQRCAPGRPCYVSKGEADGE